MNKVENRIIGCLIKVSDKNHNAKVVDVAEKWSIDLIDLSPIIGRLASLKLISQIDTETVHINLFGYAEYVSPTKRVLLFVGKYLALALKELVVFIGGVISGVLIAYLSHLFIP